MVVRGGAAGAARRRGEALRLRRPGGARRRVVASASRAGRGAVELPVAEPVESGGAAQGAGDGVVDGGESAGGARAVATHAVVGVDARGRVRARHLRAAAVGTQVGPGPPGLGALAPRLLRRPPRRPDHDGAFAHGAPRVVRGEAAPPGRGRRLRARAARRAQVLGRRREAGPRRGAADGQVRHRRPHGALQRIPRRLRGAPPAPARRRPPAARKTPERVFHHGERWVAHAVAFRAEGRPREGRRRPKGHVSHRGGPQAKYHGPRADKAPGRPPSPRAGGAASSRAEARRACEAAVTEEEIEFRIEQAIHDDASAKPPRGAAPSLRRSQIAPANERGRARVERARGAKTCDRPRPGSTRRSPRSPPPASTSRGSWRRSRPTSTRP